jgi:hypothetical protein
MPLAFVVGAPRSGTTLLRVMLAGHPRLFSPPEMVIAPFATMQERKARLDERFWEKGGLRRALMELEGLDVDAAKAREASFETWTVPEVYRHLTDRLGERTLVDKCPHLVATPEALARRATWYPDARWIWIIRHPGSVTRSVENMPMAEVMLSGWASDARSIWYFADENVRRFFATIPEEPGGQARPARTGPRGDGACASAPVRELRRVQPARRSRLQGDRPRRTRAAVPLHPPPPRSRRVRPERTCSTEGDPGPRPQGARREHARRHVTDERRRGRESGGGRMRTFLTDGPAGPSPAPRGRQRRGGAQVRVE